MRYPDVLVHIKEPLTRDTMEDIVTSLYSVPAVVKAETTHADHLIKVVYDADKVLARDILKEVKNKGVTASLVGI